MNPTLLEIFTTADGSHSLRNQVLDETYHSIHGAIQESKYVFIERGFDFWLELNPGRSPRVLEIGFGTGLNALLTLLAAESKNIQTRYQSWEAYPLEPSVIDRLNYGALLNTEEIFAQLHLADWNKSISVSQNFILHKRQGDVTTTESFGPERFDIIYYDAFAPGRQPEMWTLEVLKKIAGTLDLGGVYVTYCAKGQVKRDLRSIGLTLETLPGPPGKKEMIRAIRER